MQNLSSRFGTETSTRVSGPVGRKGLYLRFGKRAFDLFIAVTAVVLLLPLLLVVALLVRLKLGSPILFRQQRPGLNGQPFTLVKFRTMTDARDAQGRLLPDAERLTAFGRFLRSTSLDELPEFWNVLRGDMSLVGPRPLLMRYYPYFADEERVRFTVHPGITGWAQVNGRSDLPWSDRFALDVWYVRHITFQLDLRILFLTAVRAFERKDITVSDSNPRLKYDLDVERSMNQKGEE
jgi:lipopolysaccharide/colanic/teichoic acid biosynthesis glycosyltransferase